MQKAASNTQLQARSSWTALGLLDIKQFSALQRSPGNNTRGTVSHHIVCFGTDLIQFWSIPDLTLYFRRSDLSKPKPESDTKDY